MRCHPLKSESPLRVHTSTDMRNGRLHITCKNPKEGNTMFYCKSSFIQAESPPNVVFSCVVRGFVLDVESLPVYHTAFFFFSFTFLNRNNWHNGEITTTSPCQSPCGIVKQYLCSCDTGAGCPPGKKRVDRKPLKHWEICCAQSCSPSG